MFLPKPLAGPVSFCSCTNDRLFAFRPYELLFAGMCTQTEIFVQRYVHDPRTDTSRGQDQRNLPNPSTVNCRPLAEVIRFYQSFTSLLAQQTTQTSLKISLFATVSKACAFAVGSCLEVQPTNDGLRAVRPHSGMSGILRSSFEARQIAAS